MTEVETRYVGVGLHFEISTAPLVLNLLLELIQDNLRSAELGYYRVVSKPGFLRFRRASKRTRIESGDLEREFQKWMEDVIDTVGLYQDANIFSEASEVEIERATASQLLFSLVIPERLCQSVDILSLFRQLTQAGDCFFGHIDPGSYSYAKSLASFDSSLGIEGGDRLWHRFISEIECQGDYLDDYRTMVPRAAWASLLSPGHVAALGGTAQVRNGCGCCLVEEWGDNLYLQLTASPWDLQVEQVMSLGEFLEPIRAAKNIEPLYQLW